MDDFRKNPGGFAPFSIPGEGFRMGSPLREEEAWRSRSGRNGMPLPFYMTYPLPMFWEEEDSASRDLEYLIQLYPEQAKKYRERISRMLDGMDYQGSLIYDEYPDRLALFRLAESVQAGIRQEEEQETAAAGERSGPGTENASGPQSPGQGGTAASAGIPAAELKDRQTLIQILLYYEIFRRRRKNGRSWRGWNPG